MFGRSELNKCILVYMLDMSKLIICVDETWDAM